MKKQEFRCSECGRVHCCPTCRRPYESADAVAQQVKRNQQLGSPNYCGKCKTSFSKAVSEALKKLAGR